LSVSVTVVPFFVYCKQFVSKMPFYIQTSACCEVQQHNDYNEKSFFIT